MFLRKRKINAGFSQVEVLVGTGIFAFLMLACGGFFSQMNKTIKQTQYSDTRVRLFQGLISIIGMPSTLRGSMQNDTTSGLFYRSMRNDLNLTPLPLTPQPVALFLPIITGDVSSVTTSGQITGTPAAPLLYNLDGGNCLPSLTVCDPLVYTVSVTTTFMPICPPAYDYYYGYWDPLINGPVNPAGLLIPGSCNRAHYLKIYYSFSPTPGSPAEMVFAPVNGTIMVNAVLANVSQ